MSEDINDTAEVLEIEPNAPLTMLGSPRRAIEAVLMAATDPVPARELAELIEIPVPEVERIVSELAAEYARDQRGFVIAHVAGGYRYQTHGDLAPYVERFVLEGQTARLSPAALETLAIVAYKQPISRLQIAAIRGVNVDAVVRSLLQRGYLCEVGRDTGPGTPVLYGTTDTFLERLGLPDLNALPPLEDFIPEASIMEALESGLRLGNDPKAIRKASLDAAPDSEE